MRIIAAFQLLLSLSLPLSAYAQTLGAIGTRAEGMGGAFVAVADDSSAVYWNPAGIATGATFDFQVSGGGESTLFVGAALPVLGASYYRTRQAIRFTTVSGLSDRQNEGSGQVPIRAFETSNIGVTVVQTVVPGLVIGTTARLVSGGIDDVDPSTGGESRTTFDLDAGALVSAWHMRFGVTARNLREPEFPGDEGMVRMQRHVRVGAALAPRSLPTGVHGPFSLAFDADVTTTPGIEGEGRAAAAGGEYWLLKGFVGLRTGVRWHTSANADKAFSGGLTARLPRSIYVDGQVTKWDKSDETEWSVGARVTF